MSASAAGGSWPSVPSTSRPGRPSTSDGKVVCPGFIDIHTHYDAQLLWDPTASPSVLHGVTTVLGGNCGFSIAPLGPGDAPYIQRMMAVVEGIPLEALEGGGRVGRGRRSGSTWTASTAAWPSTPASWSATRPSAGRSWATAATEEPATAEQLGAMVGLVGESLAGGASGFSSSLGEGHVDGAGRPVPSRAASPEELVALAGAVRDHPGTTLEFIPTVGPIPEERMELMADMSLAADRPLNWNLLGSLASEEIYEQQLEASDLAAGQGRPRGRPGPARHDADALEQPAVRPARLAGRPGPRPGGTGGRRPATPTRGRRCGPAPKPWPARAMGVLSDFRLMEVADPGSEWVGRSLGEIAASRGTDVIDVLIDTVLVDGLTLFVVLPSLTPSLGRTDEGWAARVAVWKDRRVMLGGSDAGAHVDLMCHANYPTVVLGEVVRDRGLLSLEEAVEMMTDRPARHYGLRHRGRIAEGFHADLVVFDAGEVGTMPATVLHDLPGGGERLHAGSHGIGHVFVGGIRVVVEGEVTDGRPGRVLRSGRDTDTVSLADVRR